MAQEDEHEGVRDRFRTVAGRNEDLLATVARCLEGGHRGLIDERRGEANARTELPVPAPGRRVATG
jgi:hypothetical protein